MTIAARLRIEGRVQGVGYRDWLMREARRQGVRGWVRNRRDGTVEALVAGDQAAVDAVIASCARGPSLAAVDRVDRQDGVDDGSAGFRQLPTL